MTALKALEIFNNETENDISDEIKKQWLSELDRKIASEINNGRKGLSKTYFLISAIFVAICLLIYFLKK